ncbi:Rpn family recombination-promoting nuclease/putative transposase [Phocaeicola sp.]|nr:Rpn family recombination-promoting nuclease/putative transposase [Phocaeicola sp.]MDE5676498.1 Rpn family recombination-promoting nuclease/putative transposase [Phocaeicola sp.]
MCTEGIIDRYVNFYTDFAFKKLFGTEMNKDLLISFLNALLHGREEIQDITYLNTEHLGTQEYDRRAVFDVYCKNNQGEIFVVEMQKGEQQFFKDRSIYYSSFAIREQAPKGVWNYELKGVYTIGILNFCFTDSRNKEYYHEVKLMDTRTKELFYDKLTFIYLEMPNFIKQEDELETMFDKWMYAIRHLGALEKRPAILREKIFQRLFDVAEIAKFDRKERYEYEDSLKAYRDWFSVMETAEIRGLERGMERGLQQGIEQGRYLQLIETARKMKELGMDHDLIGRTTGLSHAEVIKC